MPFARRLDDARDELVSGIKALLEDRSRRVELASRELLAASPEAVLARGFSVVRSAEGRALRDSSSLRPGDRLEISFSRGSAAAEVLEVTK
jgi:exodeoxyribonuclease VII large subunit